MTSASFLGIYEGCSNTFANAKKLDTQQSWDLPVQNQYETDDWSLPYIVYKYTWNPQTGSFAILIAFRKRIENISEIRGFIKARYKLELNVKSVHDKKGVVNGVIDCVGV